VVGDDDDDDDVWHAAWHNKLSDAAADKSWCDAADQSRVGQPRGDHQQLRTRAAWTAGMIQLSVNNLYLYCSTPQAPPTTAMYRPSLVYPHSLGVYIECITQWGGQVPRCPVAGHPMERINVNALPYLFHWHCVMTFTRCRHLILHHIFVWIWADAEDSEIVFLLVETAVVLSYECWTCEPSIDSW